MLSGVTALDEPDLVEAVASFLDDHPIPQAGKQVDQHLERQRVNAAFRAREAERFDLAPRPSLITETRTEPTGATQNQSASVSAASDSA